ncbi:hypothetical protein HYV50_03870 [Candidatus Pacearchaeota archaeon]|nr:hypothetical protein [Candidatus Pacearchaeota archaeon]
MINTDLETRFNELAEEWENYCRKPHREPHYISSEQIKFTKEISAMGREVLPLIANRYRNYYDNPQNTACMPIASIVMKIDKSFVIPKEIRSRAEEIHHYTIKWIDDNITKK